ncbi:FAD-dependent monooxygenase [Amycolatopsis sp. NBC_01480]|uniref:FAD-dependent monooxygenase n=1 Tax=Amycolatopsis sp. NBC_01480 TaxID=2903562 RepID=UPI002E2A7BA3|nr:FAD-dependent monooxygenase [Amycolatopsis sp. NBC_01480]
MTERKSPKQPSPEVLIIGAGPTGLTLACELARSGVSFRLVEAAPGPQPGSRGKGIQPRTLEVFDDLGLVDRVLANGRISMPLHSITPDGQETLDAAQPLRDRPDIPYPASLLTPEWRIEEALRLRLAELGGAPGIRHDAGKLRAVGRVGVGRGRQGRRGRKDHRALAGRLRRRA